MSVSTQLSSDPSGPITPVSGTWEIELDGVGRTFVTAPGAPPVNALVDVDLRIAQGEWVSIVGPSGSGKSTLLNVLGLLDVPTAGTYNFEGTDVSRLSDAGRTALRGSRIGFVFQSFHLLSHRSVAENVSLAEIYQTTSSRQSRKGRHQRAAEVLERVGLGARAKFLPTKLSGGERQRVAIARALMTQPRVLLADEPTGNLDTDNTGKILELFDDLRADGLTIVVITHENEVADSAGRVVRIRDGRLVSDELTSRR